jgi:hypothetical protein
MLACKLEHPVHFVFVSCCSAALAQPYSSAIVHACRPTVLRKMKHLVKFDRRDVTAVEKSLFGDNAGALTLGMVLEHGTEGHRFGVTGIMG